MTKNMQIFMGVAALAAVGIYFYTKQNTQLAGWKKGYMVLADQINATPPAQV
jgi:hypothetical protein